MRNVNTLFVALFILLGPLLSKLSAQVLMEDFNYSPGPLTDRGYSAISDAGMNPIMNQWPSLSYPGAPSSGVAGAAYLTTSGEDITRLFAPFVNSGVIYASFLIKVNSAQSDGDYFFSLYDGGYMVRVWIKSSTSGFVFGISKNSTSATYESTNRTFETTYLVVLKYTFNSATNTDDVVSFYVNPVLAGAEPLPTIADTNSGNAPDATIIDRIALRQGDASSAAGVAVDGIRVGTTWTSVTRVAYPIITSLSPSSVHVGDSPFTLTVNGPNFPSNAVIYWNGVAKATTFANATQLTAPIASSDFATPGTIPVQVGIPNDQLSATSNFTIAAADGGVISLTSQPPFFGNVCPGTTMYTGSFTLDGTNLNGSNITLSELFGYSYSLNSSGPFSSSLSFSYTGNSFTGKTIYVLFMPTLPLPYSGNILINGGGVTNYSVPVVGSAMGGQPFVTTSDIKALGSTTATIGGVINDAGCSPITSYGIEYSTTQGFLPGTGITVPGTNLTGSSFTINLSGLAPNMKYYYHAYANNGSGTGNGSEKAFINMPLQVQIWAQPGLTYTEDFSDIANWSNSFISGTGANHFSGVSANTTTGSATLPDPNKLTASTSTFQTSLSSGGVQKGTDQTSPINSIVLLSTGSADNSSSAAIDFYIDFTGVNAGTLSFDYQTLYNEFSTGRTSSTLTSDDRTGSLIVYGSVDGSNWTEITNILNFVNNTPISGSKTNIPLPISFNNNANIRIRFYYYNGTGGTSGARPKIAIEKITVTSTVNAPLPLKMESFTARKQSGQVLLSWKTSQEINIKEFWIERSSNGIDYQRIAIVKALGNSLTNSYQFADSKPSNGDNYYRLRIVDVDTRHEFSNVQRINVERDYSVTLSPNPAASFVNLFVANLTGTATLRITDMNGRVIKQQSITADVTKVDLSALSKGFYIVKVTSGESAYTNKLLVR